MKITFFETLGTPAVDGECTALREGTADFAVAQDTLLNAAAGQPRCRIGEHDYVLGGPSDKTVWEGYVNPNTRNARLVRFAELRREDGTPSATRIVLLQGRLQRGEAVLDVYPVSAGNALAQDSLVCFTRNSRILTAFGDLPVQDLQVGDLAHTVDSGLQPIRWIGKRTVTSARMNVAPHLQPVKICANAFGVGLPAVDIWVSPEHCMVLETKHSGKMADKNGVLVPARTLVNGKSIYVDTVLRDTEYYHLLFDEHEAVFVEGMASESFYPCPASLMSLTQDDRNMVFNLMPHLEQHPLSFGPHVRQIADMAQVRILAA